MGSRDRKYQKNRLMAIEKITKFWKTLMFIAVGTPTTVGKKKVMPRIRGVFRRLAPTTLPTSRLA
jgi:hypothetical protein